MSERHRGDRLAKERARRLQQATQSSDGEVAVSRRAAARTCAWCGGQIDVQPVGRIPKWCSQACRQRAWEQKRAAESGLAAVRVVERVVQQDLERRDHWPTMLTELADQLDHGRLCRRDLSDLAVALDQVLAAYRRASADTAKRRRVSIHASGIDDAAVSS